MRYRYLFSFDRFTHGNGNMNSFSRARQPASPYETTSSPGCRPYVGTRRERLFQDDLHYPELAYGMMPVAMGTSTPSPVAGLPPTTTTPAAVSLSRPTTTASLGPSMRSTTRRINQARRRFVPAFSRGFFPTHRVNEQIRARPV
jgi:hypothetical protein